MHRAGTRNQVPNLKLQFKEGQNDIIELDDEWQEIMVSIVQQRHEKINNDQDRHSNLFILIVSGQQCNSIAEG